MGVFHCFGCQRSGDAITFVRDMEHVDFVEAVQRLADRAGVTITEDPSASAERHQRAPVFAAMEKAVDFYHERLLSAADAGPARDYLRSRGYDGEVVRQFRLGWAPDDWDALASTSRSPSKVLVEAGLGFVNRRGRLQDAFRARVLFPIFDPSGRAIALGGRILPAARSGATGSADAGRRAQVQELAGRPHLLQASDPLRPQLGQAGHRGERRGHRVRGLHRRHRVLPGGAAPGRGHLWHRPGRGPLPACSATSAAAWCSPTTPTPPGQAGAGRVYEWERRHEVDVAVAALPPGSDPGDLARSDPDALRGRHRRGPALPGLPGRAGPRLRRPALQRRAQPGGRGGPGGDRRAPRRGWCGTSTS